MGKLTTPEERAAELRARLSGQVPNRSSRRTTRKASTLSNPMFTAALHAASRDARGVELSPMEGRLVRMLKTFATDEEVAEYGSMYTETKAQAGRSTLSGTIFSGVSLNMDGDTPYTEADMVADAKAMTGDFLTMPENKIIDVTTIDAECADNPEYMEALTGAGSGITVLSAPELEEEGKKPMQDDEEGQSSTTSITLNPNAVTNTVSQYRLTLQRFKCHRKQGDSTFGPKNEVYWAVASGSDVRHKQNFKTGEYGSVESGDIRQMGQIYFQGGVEEHLAGHIECWEADDSGDSFYNRMVQTLKDISDFSIQAAVDANAAEDWGDEYGSTGKAAAILALIGICGRLVAALLEWLTNDDDLVFRREIAFTRPALTAWIRRTNGELSFMFDGGSQGKHELWIKCQVISRSTGILAGWKYSDGIPTPAPVVAGSGIDGISLVNFNNELCGVFRELNGVFYWTKYDSRNVKWSSPIAISNGTIKSGSRPAVATYNNRLYCLYRHHENNGLYCMSTSNGSSWTSPVYAGGNGGFTNDGPALCAYDGRLIGVHRGGDNRVFYNWSTNGTTWTTASLVSSSLKINKSPAIAVYNGIIHCLTSHHDRSTLCVCKYNGSSWTSVQDLGATMDSAAQMGITSNGTMIAGWRSGSDALFNIKECDTNGNWSPGIGWWNDTYFSGSPGMANWNGVLWIYAGSASV